MIEYLEQNWQQLTKGLVEEKAAYYNQLINLYNAADRHYHNLSHIYVLLKHVEKYSHLLTDPKTITYAVWYHDAIYDSSRDDNEEKSAELALEHMSDLGIPSATINTCCEMISATKTHELTGDTNSFDAQFLLDIDLSILAADEEAYIQYTKHIRQEYIIYPDAIYQNGRIAVIRHFLDMDRIYITDLFFELYEKQARKNLTMELKSLS